MQESNSQPLEPSKFEEMAAVIRSGQMPTPDVIAFLRENPEFDRWYREKYRLDEPPG